MYIFYVLASLWIVKKKIKNWNGQKLSCQKKQTKKNYGSELKKTPKGCKKETISKQQNQLFPLKSKLPTLSYTL